MTSKRNEKKLPGDDELRILVAQGATVAQLIGRFNVSKSHVYRRLKYLGGQRIAAPSQAATPIRKTRVDTREGFVSLPWISIQQPQNDAAPVHGGPHGQNQR